MQTTKPLGLGVEITRRRLEEFLSWIPNNEVTEWYMCAGPGLRVRVEKSYMFPLELIYRDS